MTEEKEEKKLLQWHAAFFADIQIELAEELTITFVCLRYPRELCNYLEQTMHRSITEVGAGIYYISDPMFPIQLLVQKRLSEEENFWLKNLTNDLKEKQKAEQLLVEYKKHESDMLYRSVMNIIVRANRERLEVNDMCEALDELLEFHFKGKLQAGWEEGRAKGMAEGRAEGRKEGKAEGRAEGRLELILSLVRDKLLSPEEAAKRVDMTVEDIQALLVNGNVAGV